MNILLINHYAGSNKHGMEYRPYYLAKEWVKVGHDVTIVAASFSHVRSKQPTVDQALTIDNLDGIRYIWLRTPSYEGNGVGRVKNMGAFIHQLYKFKEKIISISQPTVVIASSTYPLDMYPAKSIAKKAKAQLIFEVHDLWPLSPMELGNMSPYHPFIFTMQIAENFAYKNCDKVVSLLPKALNHMESHGLKKEKFNYIPNGINLEEWNTQVEEIPQQLKEEIYNLRKQGYFLFGYAGSHGVANALEYVIDAMARLKSEKVALLLVGKGAEKDNLIQKTKQLNISNVYFFDFIPKQSIPAFLKEMDALYIGWNKSPLYQFGVSPNKLFDYMMAAKPILHSIDAGNDLVAESGCGISVPPEDPESIAQGVKKMVKTPEKELEEMGEKGHSYIVEHHDYCRIADDFIKVIEK